MIRRLAVMIAVVCCCAFARDWKKFPAVAQVDGAAGIFAVGDAHGDDARLAAALRGAGIMDAGNEWIAGRAVLVSTGDMVDKGPHGPEVIRLLRKLRDSATAKGGQVVILPGNHEAEFMANPAAPKVKEFAAQLQVMNIKPADVAACKGEFGEFLCSLPFAARVNDWFFSHAGNSGGRTLAQLETALEKDFDSHGYAAAQLVGDGSVLEARLNGEGKGREPWIDAGLPARSEKQLLTDYTQALGVAHVVEGHVPGAVLFTDGVARKKGEMFQRFGLLFLIDTGMSSGVDDSLGAVLHVTLNSGPDGGAAVTAICPDGKKTALWSAREPQDKAAAKACGR